VPPIEVQSTPLCEQQAGLYPDREARWATIKGVPAAAFDGGRILEIYTADTTITIYGQRPELVQRAAGALKHAAPGNIPAGIQPLYALTPGLEVAVRALPPPDPAVLARTDPCRYIPRRGE
jgi:hypothetical protein